MLGTPGYFGVNPHRQGSPERAFSGPLAYVAHTALASGTMPPLHPSTEDILDLVERVVTRAKRAGITDDRTLASMILRELRVEGIKMVRHTFRDGERF
jgi:hypothetical protein